MDIKGLDYNTQRERLILPQYGREIQNMVDYAVALPTKEERQRCAEIIISTTDRMSAQNRGNSDHVEKLWDRLVSMANFGLNIDYPRDISEVLKIATRPEPMSYPMSNIPVRHHGRLLFEAFGELKTVEPGIRRDTFVRSVINQVKCSLMQRGRGTSDDEKIASDLARYTDGKIQLNFDTFKFEKISAREFVQPRNRKKK